MSQINTATMGLDVGDRRSHFCVLDQDTGEIVREGLVSSTREGLRALLGEFVERVVVVLETGGHSPWMSVEIEECGHEALVVHARRLAAVTSNIRKCDRADAEMLARLGRADRRLLCPVRHRGLTAQRHRAMITSRAQLVRSRVALVSHCRGVVKSFGERLPSCSTKAFHRQVTAHVPAELRAALAPVLACIELLSDQIARLDRDIERLVQEVYPEAQRLTQVPGVGSLTALCFVLTIDDPTRFGKSRDVGAYVGLVPRRDQSGDVDKQLRITKAGDRMLRTLLVQCAHYIVGPRGPDSALRRWALPRMNAGGSAMKKRTVIAVARKLAVLLHSLWRRDTEYEALRGCALPVAA